MSSDKTNMPPSKSRRRMCSIRGSYASVGARPFRCLARRRGSSVNGSKAAKLSLLLVHAPHHCGCYNITSHLSRPQLRSTSLELQASRILGLVVSKHFGGRDGISLPERQFLRPGHHRLPRRFRFYHLLRGNGFINSAVRTFYFAGAMAFLATQRSVVHCHWPRPLVFKSSELWKLPGDNTQCPNLA